MRTPDCPDCLVNRWVKPSTVKPGNYVCLCCTTVFQGPYPEPKRRREKQPARVRAKDSIYNKYVGSDVVRIAESFLNKGDAN